MQFLLTAFDGADPQAPERRLKARTEHLEKIEIRPFRLAGINQDK